MSAGHRYTHGHHASVLRSHSWRTAENSAAYLLPHLEPGTDLLDVGCGPGTITADLARRLAPGRVVGVDSAPGIVEAAVAAAGEGPDVPTYLVADVYDLRAGLEAGGAPVAYDVVHAHQVMQHVPDPVAALRSMAAVTRPRGLVAARDSDHASRAWWPRPPDLDEWAELYGRVHRATGSEPDAGRRLFSWALAAGFAEVTPSAAVWCFATAAERDWWGGLWAERTTYSAFADQALEQGASRADLDRYAAAWREWAAAPDGWFTVVHGQVLCRVP